MSLAPDLRETLAQVDQFEREVLNMFDGYIQQHGLDAPVEDVPQLRDGFDQPIVAALDLKEAGSGAVVWAMGYTFDYSLVQLPVLDRDGFPIQDSGVTAVPGLSFVGIPWMPSERSGFLLGVGESAAHIASSIVDRDVYHRPAAREAMQAGSRSATPGA